MTKRYKFQCWNCPKMYFQTLEITDQQELVVACPYCKAEAIVDLRPYSHRIKTVLRRQEIGKQGEEEFPLPDIFPTKKPA